MRQPACWRQKAKSLTPMRIRTPRRGGRRCCSPRPRAHLSSPEAERLDGRFVVHDPSGLVEAVDVLFDVVIAREPGEVLPVANLRLHLAPLRLTGEELERIGVVIDVEGDKVADGPVVNPLDRLAFGRFIAIAQSRHEREALLLGFFARLQNAAHARSIDGDRLLDEGVLARGDDRLQVLGPKVRRRGENHDVDAAVDHLLVGVEADEAVVVGDGDPLAKLHAQVVQARLHPIGKRIAQGREFEVRVGPQRVGGGATPASTAADETHLQHIAAGGVRAATDRQSSGQRSAHGRGGGGLEESASRRLAGEWGKIDHGGLLVEWSAWGGCDRGGTARHDRSFTSCTIGRRCGALLAYHATASCENTRLKREGGRESFSANDCPNS